MESGKASLDIDLIHWVNSKRPTNAPGPRKVKWKKSHMRKKKNNSICAHSPKEERGIGQALLFAWAVSSDANAFR